MKTLLTILPYAGLLLTTVSTIWGLTHELYTKGENNERRLTRARRLPRARPELTFSFPGVVLPRSLSFA